MKGERKSEYRALFQEIRHYVKEVEHNQERSYSAEIAVNELKSLFLKYLNPE